MKTEKSIRRLISFLGFKDMLLTNFIRADNLQFLENPNNRFSIIQNSNIFSHEKERLPVKEVEGNQNAVEAVSHVFPDNKKVS